MVFETRSNLSERASEAAFPEIGSRYDTVVY